MKTLKIFGLFGWLIIFGSNAWADGPVTQQVETVLVPEAPPPITPQVIQTPPPPVTVVVDEEPVLVTRNCYWDEQERQRFEPGQTYMVLPVFGWGVSMAGSHYNRADRIFTTHVLMKRCPE